MCLGKRILVILAIGIVLVVFGILSLQLLHREVEKSAHAVAPAFESLANSVHAATLLSKLIKNVVPQRQDTESTQIDVRLTSQGKSIKVGERLKVRVEIWNVGSKSVFIERAIYSECSSSPLSFHLDLGPPMKPQARRECAADIGYSTEESFATRLVNCWTSLPPRHFYGEVVTLDPGFFPELNTPGRWRLRGTYRSAGDLLSPLCFYPGAIPDIKEQIKGLPYEAWKGEVVTNTFWIEVVRGTSAGAKKSD